MLLDLESEKKFKPISLTPLIDVVFILLLFFMLSSSFIQTRKIDIPIPQAGVSEAEMKIETVTVFSNLSEIEIGQYRVNVADKDLIRQKILTAPKTAYALTYDENVTVDQVIEVMDILHSAGAQKVSIAGVVK